MKCFFKQLSNFSPQSLQISLSNNKDRKFGSNKVFLFSSMSSLRPATSYVSCSLHDAVKLRATDASLITYKPKTIPEFFEECCRKYTCLPALAYESNGQTNNSSNKLGDSKENSTWTSVTYLEYEQYAEQAALALLHLGVPARSSVSIMAFNCPEWFYIQMGALKINAVSAGIYITNSAESVFHVLNTADTSVVVVDGTQQLEKVRSIKSRLPKLRAVVQLHGPYDFTLADQKDGYYRWCDLTSIQFDDAARQQLKERESQVAPNDCALLMFTSGTVGMPKGCMISHDGILNVSRTVTSTFEEHLVPGFESLITYLPLNNLASQTFDIFMAMEIGAVVHFADRNALKGSLFKTYQKAKPTFILGVPRIFEKMHEILTEIDANSTSLTKYITDLARNTVLQYHLNRMEGKPAGNLQNWIASMVTHRLKIALGLECCKVLLIGTAPVSEAIKRYFLSVDLPLTEAYGMTETSGPIVFNLNSPHAKSSGKAVAGIEIKIRDPNEHGEGEIILRGRSNMMGYLKEPEKTKAALTDDGWVLSGDSGHIDKDGNIYIDGRIKEIIITSGGMKIPPIHIEQLLKKELPCISNAVVIGDRRKYLTVLITFKTHIDPVTGYPLQTLQPETCEWLESLGLKYNTINEMLQIKLPENLKDFDPCSIEVKPHKKILDSLEAGIKNVNEHAMTNAHKIQYFRVLPHDFTVATSELGPTLKVRRSFIHTKYDKIIQKMYE